MSTDFVQQQVHGYRSGHQLLSATIKLARDDQDLVDRLSDISGPLRPGETFSPYLTTYPLPSEQYYVIARTWQDLGASRAGCVRTRSLFISMEKWEKTISVAEFAKIISSPLESDDALQIPLPTTIQDSPVVQETRLAELVEALFLESRHPVVIFDSPDAESVTLRLLMALWASRRRTFASCTWCLAPRKLKGRDFDLVFALSDVRTKFSDWNGRRIEAGTRPTNPRHRWTTELVQAIFLDSKPSLESWDDLGILDKDQRGDEATLRLSLMWRELEAKAETTPNAVLGMLDILTSQNVRPEIARARLQPLVKNAILRSTELGDPDATWRFYLNLLGKFSDKLPSANLLRQLRTESARLADRHPESAISILKAMEDQSRLLPVVLAAGIGNGFSHHSFCSSDTLNPEQIGKRHLLHLIAYSKRFSNSLAAAINDCPDPWKSATIDALTSPNSILLNRVRRNLVPAFNSAMHASLLQPLMNGVKSRELASVVRTIGERTGFRVEAFDEYLIAAARTQDSIGALRNAILDVGGSQEADRFLLNSLRLDPIDVSWLITNIPHNQGRELLAELVDRADDGSVSVFLRDENSTTSAISLLATNPKVTAPQIARLLQLGQFDAKSFVEISLLVYWHLAGADRKRLAINLLKKWLGELAGNSLLDAKAALEDAAEYVDADDFILLLTQPRVSSSRISANIELVASSSDEIRYKVASKIDVLTERLIERDTNGFNKTTYIQWASLIETARTVAREAHIRAAKTALFYAIKLTNYPLSSLVTASFSTVYRQLLISKGDNYADLSPPLLLFPMSFFTEWDRAKAARYKLVDAFLSSNWPPADLMLVALEVNIDQQILKRIRQTSAHSDNYIRQIWDDCDRLDEGSKQSVRGAISKFTES